MKKILIILSLLTGFCFASQNECYKIFQGDPDMLFLSAISAINSYPKFELSEIQSKNGYILFTQGSKFYLLTLTKKYQNQTEIKVLPQNSDYTNNNEVAKTVFLLIENQIKNKKMELIK